MKHTLLFFILSISLTVNADEPSKREFFSAICKGNVHQVESLLQKGESVDMPDVFGQTPLMKAASCQKAAVVQALLEHKADVNAKNPMNGSTALMYAVQNDSTKIVSDLIAAHANVNIKDDDQSETALMQAAHFGNADNIELLLRAHADATAANDYGQTALMLASPKLSPDVINELITAGSDINAKTIRSSQSALMKFAQDKPMPLHIIVELIKSGAEVCDLDKNKESKVQAVKIYKFLDANYENQQISKDPDLMKKLKSLSKGESEICKPSVDEHGRPFKQSHTSS